MCALILKRGEKRVREEGKTTKVGTSMNLAKKAAHCMAISCACVKVKVH